MSPSAKVLPYPHESLPQLTRSQLTAGRALRRYGDAPAVARRFTDSLARWSGEPASFEITDLYPCTDPPTEPRPRLLIRCPVAPWSVLCCVDHRLCLAVASRLGKVISRQSTGLLDPLPPLDPALLGAVAALGSHLVDGAHFERPVRIGWGQLPESIGTRVRLEGVLHWGEGCFEVVLILDWPWLAAPLPRSPERAVARLGHCPLGLALVVGRSAVTRRELAELTPGALLVPTTGDLWLDSAGLGRAELSAPGSDWAYPCQLVGSGRIVLGQRAVNADPDAPEPAPGRPKGDRMSSDPTPSLEASVSNESGIASVLAEVPVTLRIELGTVSLPASEFASLGPGDVLETDIALRTEVTLRSGGHALLRGELVNVEGQLGVRILEFLNAEAP